MQSKNLILMYSSSDNIIRLKRRKPQNYKIISCNAKVTKYLEKNELKFALLKSYFQSIFISAQETFEWIEKWVYLKKNNKYKFIDIFKVDNISLYWFLSNELFYYSQKIIQIINDVTEVINKENPDSIYLYDSDFERVGIIKEICKIHQIKFYFLNKKLSMKLFHIKSAIKSLFVSNRIRSLRYQKIRKWSISNQKIVNNEFNSKIKLINPNMKALFLTNARHWRVSADPLDKGKKANYHFSLIYNQLLKRNYQIIDCEFLFNTKRAQQNAYEKFDDQKNVILKYFQSYSKKAISTEFKIKTKQILNDLSTLFEQKWFIKHLYYKNINLTSYFNAFFKRIIEIYFPLVYLHKNTALNIIDSENPSFIFLINESGLVEKALIWAARERNIKCYGFQHGLISEDKPENVIKSMKSIKVIFPIPIYPDYLFLYGNYYKNLLENLAQYHSNDLIVVGNPIWDLWVKRKSSYKIDKIRDLFKIPKNFKVFLYTTQTIADSSHLLIAESIVNAVRKFKKHQIFLIIKVHQRENSDIYSKFLLSDDKHIIVTKKASLGELLVISDLLLTSYSTTVFDALVFNVPSITISASHILFNSFYYKTGISNNTSYDNLEEMLLNFLTDSKKLFQFHKERSQQMINDFACGLDQKSVERIINKLIKG